jgi:hypothetical protein
VAHGRLKASITLSPPLEGVSVVGFTGIADPDQLAVLTMAVDEHCREIGIDPASDERAEIAHLVMTLFRNGASTPQEFRSALIGYRQREARRFG